MRARPACSARSSEPSEREGPLPSRPASLLHASPPLSPSNTSSKHSNRQGDPGLRKKELGWDPMCRRSARPGQICLQMPTHRGPYPDSHYRRDLMETSLPHSLPPSLPPL